MGNCCIPDVRYIPDVYKLLYTRCTLSAEPLSVSPSRLTTISALRDDVGTLEAEFSQFQIVSSGDIQQLKDKIVKQDNLLKLQKKTIDNIASDLSWSFITS